MLFVQVANNYRGSKCYTFLYVSYDIIRHTGGDRWSAHSCMCNIRFNCVFHLYYSSKSCINLPVNHAMAAWKLQMCI